MKIRKGEYGYIAYRRRQVIIRTIIYFVISLALFVIGFLVTGTKANILTIAAVLGMLPSSKSMVEAIMFIKAKESSHEDYEKIAAIAQGSTMAYELFLTAYSKNFPLSAVTVCDNQVSAYTEHKDCDLPAAQKHIKDILGQNGIASEVLIYTDLEQFINLLQQNKRKENTLDEVEVPVSEKVQIEIINIIKAISL